MTSVVEPARSIPQKRRSALFWKASIAECPLSTQSGHSHEELKMDLQRRWKADFS
jgi:hypothetical protein